MDNIEGYQLTTTTKIPNEAVTFLFPSFFHPPEITLAHCYSLLPIFFMLLSYSKFPHNLRMFRHASHQQTNI